jgi:AcrR family transcriptional regulator
MPRRTTTEGNGSEPSATLRSEHVEATRRAVLDAARSAFGGKGYAQTSVDEIAAAARVTKGAVYHHFAGKKVLFRAVFAEVAAEADARASGAGDPEAAPIDQIVARINAYLDSALDEEIRRIVLIDGPAVLGHEPDGPADQQPGHVDLRSFVSTSIAHGQILDLDPGLLAHLIRDLAYLGGLLITGAGDPATTRADLGKAIEAMLRGLAPGEPR